MAKDVNMINIDLDSSRFKKILKINKFDLSKLVIALTSAAIIFLAGLFYGLVQRVSKLEVQLENQGKQFEMTTQELLSKILERKKPPFLNSDQWYLSEGLFAYSQKDYNLALDNFKKIEKLENNDFIKWKFYESLAKFRILQYKKFIQLLEVKPEEAESINYALTNLLSSYSNNIYFEDIKYWYAQTLFHFSNKPTEAYIQLKELYNKYPFCQWKEGTLYYMSLSLLNNSAYQDKTRAIYLLEELEYKYPDGLLYIIEDDETYIVKDYLKHKKESLISK